MAINKIPVMMSAMAISAMVVLGASTANAQVSEAGPFHVNAYLCETSQYAIEFAVAVSRGEEDELAKDAVGKAARREVCGRYIGVASVLEQKVISNNGVLYRITALRFREDSRVAWVAETSFAPDSRSAWPL